MTTTQQLTSRLPKMDRKWTAYYRSLVAIRERLLLARAETLHEAAQPLEAHSLHIADSATDEFDHSLALSELSAREDQLFEVEEALKRILDGRFGICEQTGKPIPASRLRAIPWTRFSKEVEQQLENSGGVRHPHIGEAGSVRGPGAQYLEEAESLDEEATETRPNDEMLPRIFSR